MRIQDRMFVDQDLSSRTVKVYECGSGDSRYWVAEEVRSDGLQGLSSSSRVSGRSARNELGRQRRERARKLREQQETVEETIAGWLRSNGDVQPADMAGAAAEVVWNLQRALEDGHEGDQVRLLLGDALVALSGVAGVHGVTLEETRARRWQAVRP